MCAKIHILLNLGKKKKKKNVKQGFFYSITIVINQSLSFFNWF